MINFTTKHIYTCLEHLADEKGQRLAPVYKSVFLSMLHSPHLKQIGDEYFIERTYVKMESDFSIAKESIRKAVLALEKIGAVERTSKGRGRYGIIRVNIDFLKKDF